MKRFALIITSLFLTFASTKCDNVGSGGDSDAVLLRLKNKSTIDFSSAVVRFPKAESNFGAVAAGEASNYHALEGAYRYGYIEVEAGGKMYAIQPIDYVGEQLLGDGDYMYVLRFTEDQLKMEFVQD